MFEIVLLILAAGGIGAYARGRGGNPIVWGSLGVGLGIIAFCARFLLGRSLEKPSGMWSCANCKYLNQHYAVICEACKQPYTKSIRTQ